MSKVAERRHDIEWYRVVGSFSIVWYHSGAIGHDISYAGLVVFFIISMYFSGGRSSGFLDSLHKRSRRLLVPWAAWFIIYLAFNFFAGRALVWEYSFAGALLVGPSVHLWFVPYLFICFVLLDVARLFLLPGFLAVSLGGAAVLMIGLSPSWRDFSLGLGYPLAQYFHAAPAVMIGAVCSCASGGNAVIVALVLAVSFLASVFYFDIPGVGVPYSIGIVFAFLVTFFRWGDRLRFPVRSVSDCMLGVYFSHIFVLKPVMRVFGYSVASPILAFLVSFAFVFFFRKYFPRGSKYLV
ncbi:acyltransferase family protein [Methyloversatilis discipulorum]|uniref:acyltransferase family protein n=1 Tax=Methyloversatilis discipulorum TaxID=1119528 RepID=UPI003F2DCEFA